MVKGCPADKNKSRIVRTVMTAVCLLRTSALFTFLFNFHIDSMRERLFFHFIDDEMGD